MSIPTTSPTGHDPLAEARTALQRADWTAAVDSLRGHLQRWPHDADALNLLGVCLRRQDRPTEAIEALEAALRIAPDHLDALGNLALACRARGEVDRAVGLLLQLLDRHPGHALAFSHLVDALAGQARHRELVGLALQPRFAHAFEAHADEIVWAMLKDAVWDIDVAALSERAAAAALKQVPRRLLTLVPLVLWDEPAIHRAVARQFRAQATHVPSASPAALDEAPAWPARDADRLRIAYLASGFRNHVVGYLCRELLTEHDRARFEVVGYFPSQPDELGLALRAACDRHRDVAHLSTDALADRIRRDGIDVLIECDGLANGTRIDVLARRPAPVQVHFLDYPGPVGADGVDYAVVDRQVVRPGDEAGFDSALIVLPGTCHPFDTRSYRPVPASRASLEWPADAVVFGAMSNSYKLTPEVFDGRIRILRQVPGAVLVQVRPSPAAQATLRARWAAAGLEAQRLVLVDHVPHGQHLERLAQVDLCLDSFPFTSGTGAMEALWCDVPLLTREGRGIAARNAAGILATHGMPELIASSAQDFEARAVYLGNHPDELRALKRRLAVARARSPLFDTPRFTRGLEAGLASAWSRHLAGLPPAHVVVAQQPGAEASSGDPPNW